MGHWGLRGMGDYETRHGELCLKESGRVFSVAVELRTSSD
jgi:hypothetical protein